MLETITGNLDATGNFQDWAAKPDEFSSMANGMLGLKDGNLGIQSPIPNSLGVDAVEDALGSALQSVINVLGNNYAQFYQPSIFSLNTPIIDDIVVGDIGMAPEAAQLFYESADMFSGGSYNNRKYAAYASHYLQDMGNPLHTGMALEQAGVVLDVDIQTDYHVPTGIRIDTNFSSPNRWLHYGYEQLVKNEWEHNLEIDFTGWYAPPIDDGADAVRSVANETHQYADDIFHTIYENESGGRLRYPSNWSSNTRDEALEGISNCLTVTGRYNRSLLLDVGIGERPDCPYLGC